MCDGSVSYADLTVIGIALEKGRTLHHFLKDLLSTKNQDFIDIS